ncbi:MAG: phosphoenolpyruvate carboxykinase (ATP) [Clostridium sp.]|nr:phosphoenolpyruvate carboxykinase (ATP) [Clostridium sp.]
MIKDLDYLKLYNYKKIYRNLTVPQLIEFALKNNEGVLSKNGALVVNTGKYTGRSPKDRFIVVDDITKDKINWGKVNLPIEEDKFIKLHKDLSEYIKGRDLFVFDGYIGASKKFRMPIRVVCEYASQALFSNQLFIRPTDEELTNIKPEFNVICVPGFKCNGKEDGVNSEAFILIDFSKKLVLIGGTAYCGEIKKAMFSVMNFMLPQRGILPMHCSANKAEDGSTAVFFGLSGTGKTTLSTDPARKLIGDDEHGWSDHGVFNFEGGCYAKVVDLNKEKEVEIYDAIKFGAVLENVVLDEKRIPDYSDKKYTENTRAAYPINHIENVDLSGIGDIPSRIIFLTADATGIMPPISKLSKEAAMYHFMSGYTSKVAGTERGITEPQSTFSECFGAPFMLLNPVVYANLLGEKINKFNSDVYLINTGWVGGPYGIGKRIDLNYTRAMVNAVLNNTLKDVKFYEHSIFKLYIPETCPDVPPEVLNPRELWKDKDEYDRKALKLAEDFKNNFKKFKNVSEEIMNAAIR